MQEDEIAKTFEGWLNPAEYSVFLPFCKGNGIDVCCGHRTWPGAVGVDVVPPGVPYCETAPQYKSIAQLTYDCMELPFKDGVLDFVTCVHGMEHMADVKGAVLEFSRVLKPGGHLCLLTPDIGFVTIEEGGEKIPHGLDPGEFRKIVEGIDHLKIVCIDTIKNDWAFDCVALKTETGTSLAGSASGESGSSSNAETRGYESSPRTGDSIDDLKLYVQSLELLADGLRARLVQSKAESNKITDLYREQVEDNKAKQVEIERAAAHVHRIEAEIRDKDQYVRTLEQSFASGREKGSKSPITAQSSLGRKFRFYLSNEGPASVLKRSLPFIKRRLARAVRVDRNDAPRS